NGGTILLMNQSGAVIVGSAAHFDVNVEATGTGNGGKVSIIGTSVDLAGVVNANGGAVHVSTGTSDLGNGGTILLKATTGNVNIGGSLSATAPQASTGTIEVDALHGTITTPDTPGSSLTAGNQVNFMSGGDITIGTGTTITAGVSGSGLSS